MLMEYRAYFCGTVYGGRVSPDSLRRTHTRAVDKVRAYNDDDDVDQLLGISILSETNRSTRTS